MAATCQRPKPTTAPLTACLRDKPVAGRRPRAGHAIPGKTSARCLRPVSDEAGAWTRCR